MKRSVENYLRGGGGVGAGGGGWGGYKLYSRENSPSIRMHIAPDFKRMFGRHIMLYPISETLQQKKKTRIITDTMMKQSKGFIGDLTPTLRKHAYSNILKILPL